jgi:hypothetical protein
VDIKGALEMKKRLVKTRDQYEAVQLKYDLVRTSKKKKDQAEKADKVSTTGTCTLPRTRVQIGSDNGCDGQQLETELAELKKLYELTNINYANRLSKIDAKKSFEVRLYTLWPWSEMGACVLTLGCCCSGVGAIGNLYVRHHGLLPSRL